MKRCERFLLCLWTVVFFAIAPFLLRGQTNPEPPKPPAGALGPMVSSREGSVPEEQPSTFRPDDNPLTGAQEATVGVPETPSYWLTGFQFANSFQNNNASATDPQAWLSSSYVLGNLSLVNTGPRSRLALNYSGGGFVSAASELLNGYNHQLIYNQYFTWRRWQLLLLDQFSYLPESFFGYGGVSNVSVAGVGGSFEAPIPGLQSNYVPSQNIFTGSGARYSNAVVAQVNYLVSPRTSLNVTGSYDLLRFVQPGNVSGNTSISSLGYNYRISEWNTLGLVYRFSSFRYLDGPQALNDHVVQLAYGRKIPGRLGLELFGGPGLTVYRVPIGTATHRIGFTGQAQLTRQFLRGSMRASYNHGLGSGSGVLIGSVADSLQAYASRELFRKWQGTLGFGYARNRGIDRGAIASPSQNFDTWYGSAGVTRTLGGTANFSVNYVSHFQLSSQSFCINSNCGTNYIQHQVWIGFAWSTRPFVIH